LDKFDVAIEETIVSGVEDAIKRFKKIDLLVNSAGVATLGVTVSRNGDVIQNSEVWRMLLINVIGTVNVSKYVAKAMISQTEKSDRVIVHVASVAGIEATRAGVAYGGSKGAVIAITLPMARDLGR
jgi:NAD(P)-dependent dehydrogenase (short-subunit alcohol dehydrogenase family)